jgi:DNA-directed RNA polymerase subunit RPC12/RpoP
MKKQFLQVTSVITLTLMVLFLGPSAKGQNKNSTDTTKQRKDSIYTCSMHPEIQLDKPGKCPKCGMNLIKKPKVTEKKNHNHKMEMIHSMRSGIGNLETKNPTAILFKRIRSFTPLLNVSGNTAKASWCLPEMQDDTDKEI